MSEENNKLNFVGLTFDKTQQGYITKIDCLNCHNRESIYVPFGITIKDYLIDKKCPGCKCEGVLY